MRTYQYKRISIWMIAFGFLLGLGQLDARASEEVRDVLQIARKHPVIAARLIKMQRQFAGKERVSSFLLDGQCGVVGCSSTTLVVWTYQTRGANTATSSVLALVSCPSILSQNCTATPAEVRSY